MIDMRASALRSSYTRISTPPTALPLGLQQAKDHLRLGDYTDEDTLVMECLQDSVDAIEDRIGWAIMTQTIDQFWDAWPPGAAPLELLRQPVQSVTFLRYTDSTGAVTTLTPATDYVVDLYGDPPRIAPAFGKLWPGGALQPIIAIQGQYVGGYAAPNLIPHRLLRAIRWTLANVYENRSSVEVDARVRVVELPQNVEDILTGLSAPNQA